jgi:hypothetical protein
MMTKHWAAWWFGVLISGAASPMAAQSPTWTSELASLETKSAPLAGTLVVPTGVLRPPLAIIMPSVQPYVISWFKYAGNVEIARLRVPTLIVQGTSDIQVAPAEADSLKLALPSAQLLVFAGMNHVMKSTPPGRAEQMFAHTDPTVPVTPGLADSVAAFVKRVRR